MNNLRTAIEEYIAVRRKLGFKLYKDEGLLQNFVLFAEQQAASYITTELALRWATLPKDAQPVWHASRLGVVRRFAKYRSAADPRTEIPPKGLLPPRYHRRPPYIYKDHEIKRLITAALKLPSPMGLRAATYSKIFGLLAVTGMRVSEPIGLNCDDVNLIDGLLTIRHSKFGKSRFVPIHPSTQKELKHYAILRDKVCAPLKTQSFFVSERGIRLTHWSVRWTFIQLSRQIGLRGPHDSHGPRLHDIRHRFAIQTLLTWYRAGMDIEQHMSELSTYLGHTHVTDTYWYLSAVPELLQLATLRLTEGGNL